ncbi:MAG: sigma-70 family RNA polymerase sigma factor [Clostridiales bacterium]|nr:sigma-70 family RNA polymerase sigma factor [Clostridiales bacterium]
MNDSEIVTMFWARDEQALRIVSDQYGTRLNRVSYRITRDEQTAEECVNDTYLEAWNRIPPSEPRNYLQAFLYKIVRAKSLNRIIHDHRLKRMAYVDELTAELEQCIPSKSNIEEEMDAKVFTEAVNRYILMQSDEKRRVFIRRYFYMDTSSQIAERFGFSDNKVRTMLCRMRQELKSFLEKEEIL